MKWKDRDTFVLESSGNEYYANNGVIGTGPPADFASEGYDGGIGSVNGFTPAERVELADYMIGLWATFKEHV